MSATMQHYDILWADVNALGGACPDGTEAERAYWAGYDKALEDVLALLEAQGATDPVTRHLIEMRNASHG
jgi:hypothetical protein